MTKLEQRTDTEEMISNFLKNNKATECEDEDRAYCENEQKRYGVCRSKSNLQLINARKVSKLNCELCGNDYSKPNRHRMPMHGMCEGEYKGDVWCSECRCKKRKEVEREQASKVRKEKLTIEFGSVENTNRFLTTVKVQDRDIEKIKVETELVALIEDLKWCLDKRKKARAKVLRKISIAENVKNKIMKLQQNDIDDWDTPLGSWRD